MASADRIVSGPYTSNLTIPTMQENSHCPQPLASRYLYVSINRGFAMFYNFALAIALCSSSLSAPDCTPEMQQAMIAYRNCNGDIYCAINAQANGRIEVTDSGVTIFRGR